MRRPFRKFYASHVVVNLTSGTALDGYLVRQDGPLLTLRAATVHEPGAAPAPADGELVVERSRIDFIQHITDTGGSA